MHTYGFDSETILDRLECFGGFASFADKIRATNKQISARSEKP